MNRRRQAHRHLPSSPDSLEKGFAVGVEAAFLALLEAFQVAALASLRSMMRLMAQRIIATPVSGS